MPTFYMLIIVVLGNPTPFYFESAKDACKAYHVVFSGVVNKAVWRFKDGDNGPVKTKMTCQVPGLVIPPAPAPYTDYPVTEE